MKKFKTQNPNIIWEDTGIIKIYNYPPEPRTYTYITRVYKQIEKGGFGYKEVEGEPIYLHSGMTYEQQSLAIIMGTSQNSLFSTLPREKFLTEIKD